MANLNIDFFKGKIYFKCLFIRFGSLSHVHSGSDKWISLVSPRKFNNVFHGKRATEPHFPAVEQ